MKSKYKHFGNGACESAAGVFKKFGQELLLADPDVLDMLQSGAGILTSEDFDALEFTAAEKSNRHERKGPDYMARHAQALQKRAELISTLEARIKENDHVDNS